MKKAKEIKAHLVIACPKPFEGMKLMLGNEKQTWRCGLACKYYCGYTPSLTVRCSYNKRKT